MPDSRYRGEYAERYVQTLALAAGLNILRPEIDDFGVDVIVQGSGRRGERRPPGIEIQVKSWETPKGNDDFWQYDRLNQCSYNELVDDKRTLLGLLVVLLLPNDPGHFAEVLDNHDGLLLRNRAYFTAIPAEKRISNPEVKKYRTVSVPRSNVLTPSRLRRLVPSSFDNPRPISAEAIAKGELS